MTLKHAVLRLAGGFVIVSAVYAAGIIMLTVGFGDLTPYSDKLGYWVIDRIIDVVDLWNVTHGGNR